jgi:hypothetical protein
MCGRASGRRGFMSLRQDEHLDALLELVEHIGIEQLFGL